MAKIAIYTVITNNYDTLKKPLYQVPGYDYFCITDNPSIDQTCWQYIPIQHDKSITDNIRLARSAKILPHKYFKDYDYSVFVDGSLQIVGDLQEIINTQFKLVGIRHKHRSCIYEEGNVCCLMRKDINKIIKKQMEFYRQENYPEYNGLIASRIMMRQHNDKNIISFMEEWFEQVQTFSRRDQLSFNYIAEKYKKELQIKYLTVDESYDFRKYFKLYNHNILC